MPLGKRQRKLLRSFGFIVAGIICFLILLPLWFPWVFGPLAGHYGVHYFQYERAGYARFILHGATFTNQTTTFHAERIEALVPTIWFQRWLTRNRPYPKPFIRATDWQ